MPGMAASTRLTCVLGSAPKAVAWSAMRVSSVATTTRSAPGSPSCRPDVTRGRDRAADTASAARYNRMLPGQNHAASPP